MKMRQARWRGFAAVRRRGVLAGGLEAAKLFREVIVEVDAEFGGNFVFNHDGKTAGG